MPEEDLDDGRDPSGWFFGLFEVTIIAVLVATGVTSWLALLIAAVVGLAGGLARKRWPRI